MLEINRHINLFKLWKFDLKAIEETINKLEISRPVILKIFYHKDYAGSHEVVNDKHLIRISRINSRKNASFCLWHELCHAVQTYRFAEVEDYWVAYKEAGGNIYDSGYKWNPFEIEARDWEVRHYGTPLTKSIWKG